MEDKKINPQESMAIITEMIQASKQRVAARDLRASVMWAVLSIITAALVFFISLIHPTPWINLLWFIIPVAGILGNYGITRKSRIESGARTTIDVISDGIWNIVGSVAILLTVICSIFHVLCYPKAWLAMFFFAFIVVGFAAAVQGVVVKEKSYTFGGVLAIMVGFTLIAMALHQIPMRIIWVIPLYILCFVLMFIVPALIIHRKNKKDKRTYIPT